MSFTNDGIGAQASRLLTKSTTYIELVATDAPKESSLLVRVALYLKPQKPHYKD
ncbi:hypothetical protein [Paraglaciecola mesophila]|uniref:hypothetical protein n=1 Tax=Paraglaciecola mesophila TaxID=197222 RepID=UPI00191C28C0|nr:hypothetical protein [Paraglaciecola mesophila]